MSKALQQIFNEVKPLQVSKTYASLCAHFPLTPIQSDSQMRRANRFIDRLVDYLGSTPESSEANEVEKYLTVLADLVSAYESKRFVFEKSEPREILAYLMQAHQLNQSDLHEEIGSQSVVSEILNGHRNLNISHIKKLANRFNVSPALFVG